MIENDDLRIDVEDNPGDYQKRIMSGGAAAGVVIVRGPLESGGTRTGRGYNWRSKARNREDNRTMTTKSIALLLTASALGAHAAPPHEEIRKAGITGGVVAQAGSGDLALKELGSQFHVRLLLPDAGAVEKTQTAIGQAGLQGRFTASVWDGKSLPFADRTLNAVVLAKDGLVAEAEAMRALAPRGLLLSPSGAISVPVPVGIDDWTHFLYDASGNAVSKDTEVASPRSLRWRADPRFAISHNAPASLLGMVSAQGRIFYLANETTYLLDKTGPLPERWFLAARDGFNGAVLWKRPLRDFGVNRFEEVGMQPGPGTWRTPMNLNRRVAALGDRVYATLGYGLGPLSVLDAATGAPVREIDLGGAIDEIIADGERVVCRVRREISAPKDEFTATWQQQDELKKQGIENPSLYLQEKLLEKLKGEGGQELVAVAAADGKVLWRHAVKAVANRAMAMAEGKVVYHNYEGLVALDAATGEPVWELATPWDDKGNLAWWRAYFGDLLIAEGKVYWGGSKTGGFGVNLADGAVLWKDPNQREDRGFSHPLAVRVIGGKVYRDSGWVFDFATGKRVDGPNVGDMLKRGHHVRCYPGKATERFLIMPIRGAEFVDLRGGEHMVNDWMRASCSYGVMPANGLLYNTPDPCSCYAGARLPGLMALAGRLPSGLDHAPPPEYPARLERGPAYQSGQKLETGTLNADAWSVYMADPRRSSMAGAPLSADLSPAWSADMGGDLTQATIADGKAYLARKDRYEMICIGMAGGKTLWSRCFPAALDGPPTIVGDRLFIGCRDGRVYALDAADGALAWRRLIAPLERLTLGNGRLENTWPAHSSVLYLNGLVYAAAGNHSNLDGGIHLAALDPATGELRHRAVLEGPWPDKETLRAAVIPGDNFWKQKPEERGENFDKVNQEYATGYHVYGGQTDLLVTDAEGGHLYMAQNKFSGKLEHVPLRRTWHTGYTPMGGMHILANFGLLDDSMFHRTSRMFNDGWPSYGSGPGSAARSGSLVAVGKARAYAAQHFSGGGYAGHQPGSGNRLVADPLEGENVPDDMLVDVLGKEKAGDGWREQKKISRTVPELWQKPTPLVVRSLLAAPDGQGGELVFAAGVVEGKSVDEWAKSLYFEGPGKLQVFNGADGALLKEYDLPAAPVFDGMSAAGGKLIIPMANGRVHCLITHKN